jgi:pyridoxamine 5'-phosphate oxidase
VPPGRFELPPLPPEGSALSPELWGPGNVVQVSSESVRPGTAPPGEVHRGGVTDDIRTDRAETGTRSDRTDPEGPTLRERLRSAKVFHPELPTFDVDDVADDAVDQFVAWLVEAVDQDVAQPHAMVISTSSSEGDVTARTLLLKDVDDGALWFATSSISPKGRQIVENPRVALTLYWREQGRQVRVLGRATPGPRDVSEKDFTARHPDSRAVAMTQPQSSPITDEAETRRRLADAKAAIESDDALVPDDWTAWRVDPTSIEFWQATTGRDQVRLRYDRDGDGWTRASLWP